MFNSVVFDVVIGLVFVYLLYSLLATIIQEMIATNFGFRAKILERAITRMLEDDDKPILRIQGIIRLFRNSKNWIEKNSPSWAFYNHPLMKYLGEDKFRSKPAYIDKETFSKVMVDLLRGDQAKPTDDISALIQKALDDKKINWGNAIINDETLSYLKSIWTDSGGNVEAFRVLLETWFEQTMERASGWYKKYTQVILLVVGFIIAILFNVDTIKIAGKLSNDPKLREQIVQQANAFTNAHPNLDQDLVKNKAQYQALMDKITAAPGSAVDTSKKAMMVLTLNDSIIKAEAAEQKVLFARADSLLKTDIRNSSEILGIGLKSYECGPGQVVCFLKSLAGWLITALALSLGAPFWFDLLNKLMKLRTSIVNSSSDPKQKTK